VPRPPSACHRVRVRYRHWRARATPDTTFAEATAGLRGGEVVLRHDAGHSSAPGSWERTVAALSRILEAIGAAGLGCAPVLDPREEIAP
jgi:hypothetical protein